MLLGIVSSECWEEVNYIETEAIHIKEDRGVRLEANATASLQPPTKYTESGLSLEH